MINPAAQELLDDRSAWRRLLEWLFPEKCGPKRRYVCIRVLPDRGPVCYFCSESQKTLYAEIPPAGQVYEKQQDGSYIVKFEYMADGIKLKYDFKCSKEQVKEIFNYQPGYTRKRKRK